MKIRFLTNVGAALLLAGSLSGCQTLQIQDPQAPPAPSPEAVPAALLTSAPLDSIIRLTTAIDFSVVDRAGHGPTGKLIFWGNRDTPGRWSSYTYDGQGRLIGIFTSEYGQQKAERAIYQGNYLAEAYLQGVGYWVYTIKRYRYDSAGYRRQTLLYSPDTDNHAVFRLRTRLDHDYDAQGQLLSIRQQSGDLPDSYWQYHWQNGDCVRQEQYTKDPVTRVYELRQRYVLRYSDQADPVYALPLCDEYTTRPSRHFPSATMNYDIVNGVEKVMPGCTLTNVFMHDAQGRLTQMRPTAGNLWDYYVYAP